MGIIDTSQIIGDLIIAGGDGSDPFGDGVSLVTSSWTVGNLGPLWVSGDVRGSDVLMPGAVGVRPYRRRETVTAHSLSFTIAGDVHHALGEDCDDDDPWTVLEENLQYLHDELIEPPGTRSGTRAARLVMPSGAERIASVHVLRFMPTTVQIAFAIGSLDISIPSGSFKEAVS